jgi:hypothetical protein
MAVQDQLEQHAASGARTASARDCEHLPGKALVAQGMVLINDDTSQGIHSAPEAETNPRAEQFALCTARHECPAVTDELHAITS